MRFKRVSNLDLMAIQEIVLVDVVGIGITSEPHNVVACDKLSKSFGEMASSG